MKYRLGDICTITKGETGIMKAIPGAYTMVALGEANKTHNEYQFDAKAVIIPLVSSTGHGHASMKRVKYQEGKFALGNILCAVIPKDESFVLAKYLHIYLHWNREELLVSQMKGMANVSLPMNRIADVEVIVPSIEKQKQIVELEAKLVEKELEADKLFADQLTQIENLNQAISQEAVQGKLVLQDKNDEPASELLKRIKAEKAKSGKKEKLLPPIKPDEIPFDIPENWVWCRLGDVIDSIVGGGTPSKMNASYWNGNIPWASVKDLKGKFLHDTIDKITEIAIESSSTNLIPANNIIVCTRMGLGKICINKIDTAINQDLKAVFLNKNIEPEYFYNYYRTLKIIGSGMTVNGIKQEQLLNFHFPLPPLSEQKRIVAEIEKQLAKTKLVKEHIIANQQATEQLLKALLHQAFEVN